MDRWIRRSSGTGERHSPRQHLLDGFPDAAVRFFRALEAHRSRLAAEHGLSEIELRCLFRIGAAAP
ncbi:hypothetical protein Q0F99_15175 [Rathayibacter oskolensis]|uniref:hypothetical protein n=1 Tax=Rathayibacter oskolensis TaxID=1891671 RepID=UPI00266026CD|nr:hypothetical protein [Rathayibacter oskolensis]WKK71006.1 hypothetical protein Q0F99_15175 [Rathayibacter oskolensis]